MKKLILSIAMLLLLSDVTSNLAQEYRGFGSDFLFDAITVLKNQDKTQKSTVIVHNDGSRIYATFTVLDSTKNPITFTYTCNEENFEKEFLTFFRIYITSHRTFRTSNAPFRASVNHEIHLSIFSNNPKYSALSGLSGVSEILMDGEIYKHFTSMGVYDGILYIRPAVLARNSANEYLSDGLVFQLPVESALKKYDELKELAMIQLKPALEKFHKENFKGGDGF